jgi:RNA recognition motif-containing protein
MNTKLYVGNLSFDTTENDLQDMFQQHGPVSEVNLITDRMSGRSRGFGFVTMSSDAEGKAAIDGLHGNALDGRNLTVNDARPREDRPQKSFSGARRY